MKEIAISDRKRVQSSLRRGDFVNVHLDRGPGSNWIDVHAKVIGLGIGSSNNLSVEAETERGTIRLDIPRDWFEAKEPNYSTVNLRLVEVNDFPVENSWTGTTG